MPAIATENLSKRFGEVMAVDGLTIEVHPGELFAFLGPNGAGKTTTIHMLCTLLRPTTGSARVAGHDCVKEAWAVRRAIGLVFQESTLDKDLTVEENLWFTCRLYDLPSRLAAARIAEILDLVGLNDRKDQLTKQLSGGDSTSPAASSTGPGSSFSTSRPLASTRRPGARCGNFSRGCASGRKRLSL
jgi:ABC-2 type transport system ATP-binding protein